MTSVSRTTCVVLAGGLGTRLRSAVSDLPKCLAPVGDRTFLSIQVQALAKAGVSDVVLSLGYLAEKVIASVASEPLALPVRHVVEKNLLGTGGAIKFVLDVLELDEVLVANGDTYLDGHLGGMLDPLDRRADEMFRMAVVSVDDRTRFGGVEVDGKGRVRRFHEKGQTGPGLINAGLYRLCRGSLPTTTVGAFSLESDVLPALASTGQVRAAVIDGEFIDIGVPSDYRRFCEQHGR